MSKTATPANETTCWPRVVTRNAFGWVCGIWAVLDLATEWPRDLQQSTLALTGLKRAVGEAWFNQLIDRVKPMRLFLILHLLQTPTPFYLVDGRRCSWCNGYRHRIWTRRYEFNSWTRLIALHIALIPLGNVWIQLFSLQLLINSRVD